MVDVFTDQARSTDSDWTGSASALPGRTASRLPSRLNNLRNRRTERIKRLGSTAVTFPSGTRDNAGMTAGPIPAPMSRIWSVRCGSAPATTNSLSNELQNRRIPAR